MTTWSDFKKPTAYIPTILALIGIPLSIYLYYSAQEKRDPVCYYNDSSIVVYNSQIPSSSIKLLHNDSNIVKDNVYLNEITLWNNGELPIMPEDVRDTFRIYLPECTKILDYKIIAQTRSSSHFILNIENDNTLILKWKYFDPDYAVKFQIIYTGNKNFNIIWKTNIIGVDEIKKIKKSSDILENEPEFILFGIMGITIVYLIVFKLTLSISLLLKKTKWNDNRKEILTILFEKIKMDIKSLYGILISMLVLSIILYIIIKLFFTPPLIPL